MNKVYFIAGGGRGMCDRFAPRAGAVRRVTQRAPLLLQQARAFPRLSAMLDHEAGA
jgi:hypothetical protein